MSKYNEIKAALLGAKQDTGRAYDHQSSGKKSE